MPQVDFITFLSIIFWFCFILIFGYISLNYRILNVLNFFKKTNINNENFKLILINNKNYLKFFNFFEEKNTTKN